MRSEWVAPLSRGGVVRTSRGTPTEKYAYEHSCLSVIMLPLLYRVGGSARLDLHRVPGYRELRLIAPDGHGVRLRL